MRLIDLDAFWNYVRGHKINFGKYQHDLLNKQSTVQAIPIPQNATNGDVIKAMFPCLEKYEYEELYTHGIALAGNDNRVTWFTNDWWNAPYEGSDTK